MSLVGILIALIVIAIICYAIYIVLGMLPLPQPVKTLVWLLVAVIFLIVILEALGVGTVGSLRLH